MRLPVPPVRYDPAMEAQRNATLEMMDAQSLKRGVDLELVGTRLILRSPDGSRWSVTVDDAGVLSATAL